MPFKSPRQARLFRAAASNPRVARATGVPQRAAQEFIIQDRVERAVRADRELRMHRSRKVRANNLMRQAIMARRGVRGG